MCIRDSLGALAPRLAFDASWPAAVMGTVSWVLDLCPVSYTHLRAHETRHDLVCRLLRFTPLYSSAASDVYKRQPGGPCSALGLRCFLACRRHGNSLLGSRLM